jgi:hypothetical protein
VTLPRPQLASALVALAAGVAAIAPASAATAAPASPRATPPANVLSVEANDTAVDGWSGWLVWSRRDAAGTYGLVVRRPDGVGVDLPVQPQTVPIDASVGPGPDGGPLVVYTVCARPSTRIPTGCDVLRIDPRTGLGGPVPAASSPTADERFPSVWGDQIAFSSTPRADRPGRTGIAIAPIDGASVAPTVFGPRAEREPGGSQRATEYGAQGIDLREGTLAYSWRTTTSVERWRLYVRRATDAGSGRSVVRATTDRRTISRLGRPALSATDVVAPRLRTGARSRSELVRATLGGTRLWSMPSGFTAAQTQRYGSALTAVARQAPGELVVVRRLASDGRWSCKNAAVPETQGCEVLALPASAQRWRRIAQG